MSARAARGATPPGPPALAPLPPFPLLGRLVDATADVIADRCELLTELDRAIGDADHGVNMLRGFTAIARERGALVALPLADALERMGQILVMRVGGAAGPLYGSLLLAMGAAARRGGAQPSLAAMLVEGVAAVQRRGRSRRGEKTMLDVLIPVQEAWARAQGCSTREAVARIRAAASAGLEATRPLLATKGRASYLRERSIGHLDPGACSSQLLVCAACDILQEVS